MNPKTIDYLLAAGWKPERIVDTKIYKDAFKKENLPLYPNAEKFLSKFGSLIIRYFYTVGSFEIDDILAFCANETVVGMGGCKSCELFSPIGDVFGGTGMLFMNEEGQVYGIFNEEFDPVFFAETGEDAIDKILSGNY